MQIDPENPPVAIQVIRDLLNAPAYEATDSVATPGTAARRARDAELRIGGGRENAAIDAGNL
jgi:hypothetical protein